MENFVARVVRLHLLPVALVVLLCNTFPSLAQVQPTERKLDGGITHINLSVPVSNGKFVRSDVYLPPSDKPLPGVLVLPTYYAQAFGGSEDQDKDYAIALAKQGYATLVPVLTSQGSRDAYSPAYGEDMSLISRWLRDRPEVIDDRIGAVGFSIGSFHAALFATADPTVRAIVGYYGVYNIEDTDFPFSRLIQRFWEGAPMRNAVRTNGAVLLLHGDADNETPIRQVTAYRDALAAAGKPVELVVYPKAHHRFDRGPTIQMQRANQGDRSPQGHIYRLDRTARDDAWTRTNAWLEKYLKAD